MNINWKRGFRRVGWFLYGLWVVGWTLGTAFACHSALYESPAYWVEVVTLTADGRLFAEDVLGKREPLKDYELAAVRCSWRHREDQVKERTHHRTGSLVKSADGRYRRLNKEGKWEPVTAEQLAKASRKVYSTPSGDLVVNDRLLDTQRSLTQQELDSVQPTNFLLRTVAEHAIIFALGGLLAPLIIAKVVAWLVAGFKPAPAPQR